MLLVLAVLELGGPPCATGRDGGRGGAFVCPRRRDPETVVVISISWERRTAKNTGKGILTYLRTL